MNFDGLKIPPGTKIRRGFRYPFGGWLELEHRWRKKFALCAFVYEGRWEFFVAPSLTKYNGGWCSAAEGFRIDGVFAGRSGILLFLSDGERRRKLYLLRGRAVVTDDTDRVLWAEGDVPRGTHFVPDEEFSEIPLFEGTREEFGEIISAGLKKFLEIKENFLRRRVMALLRQEIKRVRRALEAVRTDREKLGDPHKLRHLADAIMANLHAIPRGVESAEIVDPYTGEKISVRLDPRVPPVQFANSLYARARRAERGAQTTAEREKHLSEKLQQLERLTEEKDYNKVAEQLGIDPHEKFFGVPESERSSGKVKSYGPGIRRFVSSDGFEILVGRSAGANNRLTFEIAARDDIWLHAEGVKGAHVVIRLAGRKDVPRSTIEEAASLAAFFSDAKHASLVPVVHTRRRYVHPVKGKPGLVRLDRAETIFVEPREKVGE